MPHLIVGFLAGFVNGATGFGYALVTVNLLGLLVGPKEAIVVTAMLGPLVAIAQIGLHRRELPVVRRVGVVVVTAFLGAAIGSQVLVALPRPAVAIGLGGFTAWYALTSLRQAPRRLPDRFERWLGPIAGIGTGLTSGAIGASGPLVGTYFQAIGLSASRFAVAMGVVFLVMSATQVVTFAAHGLYTPSLLGLGGLLVIPSLVGVGIGFATQERLPRALVQRGILVLLLVASLLLLAGGLGAITCC